MRILMLTDLAPALRLGGSERFAVELARALEERGHQVTLCGAQLRPGNWPVGLYHARVGSALRGALLRAIRRQRPQLLHVHHPLASRLAALTGLPLVRTIHGSWAAELAQRRPGLARFARLAPDWLMSPPAGAALAVASPDLQAELPRAVLIEPGVDCERFQPGPRPADEQPRIGTVCRLSAERGLERFCRLAATLKQRARFEVAGDGPLARRIAHHARKTGATIHWRGPTDDVPGFLATLELYVNPSTTESFGLALLEAMACGLPVVAAPSDGAQRLLQGGAGIIADPLEQAVARLLDDPAARQRLGSAARERALQFSWRRTAQAYEELYQSCA